MHVDTSSSITVGFDPVTENVTIVIEENFEYASISITPQKVKNLIAILESTLTFPSAVKALKS